MRDIQSIIKQMDFFQNLSDDHINTILPYFQEKHYQKKEIVFEEYTPGDSFFIILEGEIEIYKHLSKTIETTQAELDILRPYSYFGEMSLVDDYPRSATVKARTNVVLLKMTKKDFIDICMQFPIVIFNLMRTISVRLRNTNQKFVEIVDQLIKESRMAAIGTAASKIVHDIKTPITVMILTAELISSLFDNSEKYTEKIVRQAKALDEMVREILDFARGEQSSLNLHPVVLDNFFRDVLESIGPIGNVKNIDITVNNIVNKPVVFDEGKFKRLIINIIKNAVEAIDENQKINIASSLMDDKWQVIIQDSGQGIPEDIIDSLFEPFVTKGKKGGTGLGLAISKKIVEDHNGSIQVSNTLGQGACFDIRIPLINLR